MIETLFDPKKNIRRTIEKVITFGASQEDRLRSEIAEYEVTEAIDELLVDLLTKMQIGMESGGPNEVGVWLSGFYGSGKSSLAKYLGFALDDRVYVDGVRFLKHFQDRLRSPQAKALLAATAASHPAAVVMLDLASEMVAGNTMEDVSTVLYYKVLQWAGYSRNLKVAALERKLQKDGRFEEFRQTVREDLGAEWEEYQNDPLVVDSLLPEFAHRLYPELFRTPTSFSTETAEYISFESDRVAEMLNLVREHSGKQHIIFIIDEVGQYIASRPNLILNLDGLAKNLKNIGDGKVWIVATAQQTLTEDSPRAALNSLELYKLNDRFPIKIDLPSSDIRQICTRRLLGKSTAGEARLKALFAQHGQALRQNTKLEDARFYDADLDEASFVNLYPFLPAHFDILLHLLGVLAKSTGGVGLRSAIKIVQDVLIDELDHNKPLAEQPIGLLVTAVTLYDALEKDIRRVKDSVHKGVDKARIRFPDTPIHQQVAKTVAILQTLDNMPITAQNIASLLHPAIDAPSTRAAVDGALAELTADPFVPFGEHEGGYRFFSERINDIEQERVQVVASSVERRRALSEALKACFDPLPSAQLHATLTVTAGVRMLSGSQLANIAGEREPIQIQLEFADAADHDSARTRLLTDSMQPAGRSTIYLVAQNAEQGAELAADIVRSNEIILRHGSDADQEVREYCRGQETRVERLRQELVRLFRQSLVQGSFIFRGQSTAVESLHADLKEAARRQLGSAAQQIFDRYAEAPVRAETNTAELFLRAGNLRAITSKIDPLGLVQVVGGTPSINTHHKAIVSIHDHLDRSGPVEGRRLTDHFDASPFGWSPDTVRYIVAAMLIAGEVALRIGGREITVPDQQVIDALKNNMTFKSVGVTLRTGTVGPGALARAATRLTQLTGETVYPLEFEISKAARKHLPASLSLSGLLAERLASLALPGVDDVRALGETIQELLLADARDAAQRFGSEKSDLYDSLVWVNEVDKQLRNGLESTVRELQRHRREIDALPTSGLPGALKQELAERLQSVQERLGSESFHTHAADLTIDLTQIQAAVGTCAAAMQGAQAASLHAAKEALERLPDWQLLEKPQQLEYFGRIEALELSPTANLDGIKSLLNQQYTLGQTLGQVEKLVAAEGEQKRIERLQAERERLLHEGKTKLQRRVDVPARITERGELDTLITTLNSVAAEISVYADIEITLTVKD